MKKSLLLLGAGVMLLTSCSNDELVNPVANTGKDLQPIGFDYKVGNMGRAAEAFENTAPAFGVWAYKGTTQADAVGTAATTGDQVVMYNYLVGYANKTADIGYVPTKGQVNYGPATNYWYYEGLGKDDAGYTWKEYGDFTTAKGFTAPISKVDNQYLKYWDESADFHYFYAYAPYDADVTFGIEDIDDKIANEEPYMQFEGIQAGKTTLDNATGAVELGAADGDKYMYAAAKVHGTGATGKNRVPLSFNRLLSKIRIAFYESVPGYQVELCGLSTAENAVVFAPTHKDDGTYSQGSYLIGGKPRVYFTQADKADPIVSHLNYSSTSTWDQPIYYPYFWLKDGDSHTAIIPEAATKAGARFGEFMSVLPADALNPNDGFTLNVTLKFTADDTQEVFYVYGARVYVPAEAVQWKPNTVYTYYFHITKGLSGTTGTPEPDIAYGPDPRQSLIPIVFEDVTIEKYEDHKVDYEYNLN